MPGDEIFMRRALELARSVSFASPNPRVGAVIASGDRVVGEGAHHGPGTPHAEAAALEGIDARGATCYVTLEPCVHFGATAPCAPLLHERGIVRVVAALEDPDPRVAGRGFDYLRSRGITVEVGLGREEAARLNAPYIHHRTTGRPRVTLKLALTLDGRLAAADGSSRWISGPEARRRVHARRAEVDAVAVGAGTVVADDPSLTVRDVPAERHPARVVVDARGRVTPDAKVFAPGGQVVVATTSGAPHETAIAWKEAGAEVLVLPATESGVDLAALLDDLGRRGWLELYVEGGARLATSFLASRLVDRMELFYGPKLVGADGAGIGPLPVRTMEDAGGFDLVDVQRVGDTALVVLERS